MTVAGSAYRAVDVVEMSSDDEGLFSTIDEKRLKETLAECLNDALSIIRKTVLFLRHCVASSFENNRMALVQIVADERRAGAFFET